MEKGQANIEQYKKDLESLLARGRALGLAMEVECFPEQFKNRPAELQEKLKGLPNVAKDYQAWYSEAKVLVKQLLPDRLADFVSYYERPKRKDITYESYRIEDYLQGLSVTKGYDKQKVVGPDAAISQFRQQLAILLSVGARFESSLFDIRHLVQADLFDSELDAAEELASKKFYRAAGAMAGVVLERHLGEVCDNHGIKLSKKEPTIGDLNNALKEAKVIEIPQWRFIQHLADLRNLCDHDKKTEPTAEQVMELIRGVKKTIKTLF